MAILGSFRGGSEVAFVTSVFFALSSVTYCAAAAAATVVVASLKLLDAAGAAVDVELT